MLKNVLPLAGLILVGMTMGCRSTTQSYAVPFTGREQDLTTKPELYGELDKECGKEFEAVQLFKRLEPPYAAVSRYKSTKVIDPAAVKKRQIETLTPGELVAKYPAFGKTVNLLLDEAGKAFASRNLAPPISDSYEFLSKGSQGGMKFVLLHDAERKTPTGRYFPLGRMVLLVNPEKMTPGPDGQGFADQQYADRLFFVISHELGHAVAMHSEEQESDADAAGDAAEGVGSGISDAALGSAYATFGYDFGAASLLNSTAESYFTVLGLSEEEFQKYEAKRNHAAKAALGFAANTALGFAGAPVSVSTSSPLSDRSTFVIKKMTGMGLDGDAAIKLMASGVKDLNFTYTFMTHSKRDEFEADRIGFTLFTSAGRPAAAPIDFFNEKAKEEEAAQASTPTVFDGHPPARERSEQLAKLK